MLKKIIFSLLILMLLVIIPINLKATTNVLQVSNTIFNALRGSEFETTIFIEEGSNVTGLTITLKYDKQLLTLKDYEELDASEVNVTDNTIIIVYSGADKISDQLDLVKLTFEVEEQIGKGNYDKWLYLSDDSLSTSSSTFTPINIRAKGDAYDNKGDGKINSKDATYILQHAARMLTLDRIDQYYANVYEDYDSEGNPKISAKDATLILQYAAHMDVEINDRYEIVFYVLSDNNEYIKYISKSIKKGEVLNSIPEGTWSLSSEEYIEVDFNNITEDVSVYEYEETKCSEGLEYTLLSNDTYEVSGIGTCIDTEIIIPSKYNNKNVTSIGDFAFENVTSFSNIIIPNSVTNIKSSAFDNCNCLRNVYYEGTLEQWMNINFSDSDSNPMNYASNFYMRDENNEWYQPTEIIVPLTINSIKDYTFYGFEQLTKLEIHTNVTAIGNGSFAYCANIKNVIIPTSVMSIGNGAFEYCHSVTNIEILGNITSIGDDVFYYCMSLVSITIPSSVTSIGGSAFYMCYKLTNVYFGGSLEEWMNISFSDNFSNPMWFGDSFYMKDESNEWYKPTKIVIPSTITSIKDYAFCNWESLTKVEIPSSVTSIGNYAFKYCKNLKNIEIPSSVTSIGNGAFENCYKLISIDTLGNITTIGNGILENCSSLTNITIPLSVTNIGEDAFLSCNSLTNVYYEGSIEQWMSISFYDHTSNPMYYASNFYMRDKNNEWYKPTEIVIPSTITSINDYTFYNWKSLTKVEIPNSVTSIGWSAFYNCISLTNITIPSSVTSIDDSAFNNCTSLTSIEIPSSVKIIGTSAFYNCESLESIIIPNSVTKIGFYTFYNCKSLTSIEIPSGITNIGSDVFYNCESLEDIYYTGTIEQWVSIGFDENNSNPMVFATNFYMKNEKNEWYKPTEIVIPSTVTNINNYAFFNWGQLTSVVIPTSVSKMGMHVFFNCVSLTIYCQSETIPAGWMSNWNSSHCPEVWGYK